MSAVTLLGLGTMGVALARAMQSAGHDLTVWNRTPGRAPELDVRRAGTAASAVADATLVIVCLLDDRSVSDVLRPIAHELRGRAVINLTSCTPTQARGQASWAAASGIPYVDGGIMAVPAMIGTPHAMVLYAGEETAFGEARDVLEVFGKAIFVGPDTGRAALVDLSLLVSMYGLLGAFAQAAVMAESEGMKVTELATFAVPWVEAMTTTLPAMAKTIDERRFGEGVGSSLAMQHVGLGTIIEATKTAGADPALMLVIERWMHGAIVAGHGTDDFDRVVDVIRQRS